MLLHGLDRHRSHNIGSIHLITIHHKGVGTQPHLITSNGPAPVSVAIMILVSRHDLPSRVFHDHNTVFIARHNAIPKHIPHTHTVTCSTMHIHRVMHGSPIVRYHPLTRAPKHQPTSQNHNRQVQQPRPRHPPRSSYVHITYPPYLIVIIVKYPYTQSWHQSTDRPSPTQKVLCARHGSCRVTNHGVRKP